MSPDLIDILRFILPGIWITLQVSALSIVIGFCLSVVVGALRTSGFLPLRLMLAGYVQLFRGTSLLVQIFYFFFVLPLLGIPLGPFWAGVWALSLNAGAYGSEIVRGAIASVDRRQIEAAIAINLSPLRTFWRIVLPQALAWMILPFATLSLQIVKSTPLLALISVADMFARGQMYITVTGQTARVYLVILVVYYLIGLPIVKIGEHLQHRYGNRT